MDSSPPVGILAGFGRLPLLAARSLVERDREVIVCSLAADPPPELSERAAEIRRFEPEEFGSIPGYLSERGVRELLMVGAVSRTALFEDDRIDEADDEVLSMLEDLEDMGDEALLETAAALLQTVGIRVIGVDEVMEECLTPAGHLAGPEPSESARRTLEALTEIGGFLADHEVGQSIAGKRGSVVAVEAAEGTSRMIRRAGELAGRGCVVLKRARSDQRLQFDVPVVGEETFRELADVDAELLALEAHRTLWVQQEACRSIAREQDVAFLGWEPPGRE